MIQKKNFWICLIKIPEEKLGYDSGEMNIHFIKLEILISLEN